MCYQLCVESSFKRISDSQKSLHLKLRDVERELGCEKGLWVVGFVSRKSRVSLFVSWEPYSRRNRSHSLDFSEPLSLGTESLNSTYSLHIVRDLGSSSERLPTM